MTQEKNTVWLDLDVVRRLAEVGFLASECGLAEEAEEIFSHLVTAREGSKEPARIALAIAYAKCGRMARAVEELRDIVEVFPESSFAKALLGELLVITEAEGALALLESVLEADDDPVAVGLASDCVELAHEQRAKRSSSRPKESIGKGRRLFKP